MFEKRWQSATCFFLLVDTFLGVTQNSFEKRFSRKFCEIKECANSGEKGIKIEKKIFHALPFFRVCKFKSFWFEAAESL
jgi:hypothetical protein